MRISPRRAGLGAAVLSLVTASAMAPLSADASTHAAPSAVHAGSSSVLGDAAKWHATTTRGIGFKGERLGATPRAKRLHLAVALSPRHPARLAQALKAMYQPGSATYHHFLSPAQYRAAYSPKVGAVSRVTAYLHREGLTGVHVARNRLLVTADASVGDAERAFNTRIVSYRLAHRTLFANRTTAMVPSALGHVVSSVSGLNNYKLHTGTQHARPARRTRAAGSPSTAGLYPTQFQTTYDAVGTATGNQTSIAVLTEGDSTPVIADLRKAEAAEGTAQVPVTVVPVGAASSDVSGLDEFDMDTQAASMMATNVQQMYLYNVPSLGNADIVAGINRFVSDDKASAMSASLGECELFAALSGDEATVDTLTQEGALQGQTLFASSGDEGDACSLLVNLGAPVGVPQVEWPASGTNTIAVGGTSLVADASGNRVVEPAWLGGGGGTSELEAPGAWTKATDPLYAAGLRAVPDIALDADPDTAPVIVYVNGAQSLIGGTSLSSPLMLGVWARLESAQANSLGLAGPALYGVYDKVNPGVSTPVATVPTPLPAAVPGFTDVILGSNGLYSAAPGWDYTTGLGAPDVKQLVAALG